MKQRIKKIVPIAIAGVFSLFVTDLSAQCKIKSVVKQCMSSMEPYQYDSYVVKEIVYKSPKKETLNFEVFSDEEYKLIFGQSVLPQEIGITIYGMEKGKKKILYFDESAKKSPQMFYFAPNKSGTYYIEYEIPPATSSGQKGCFIVVIGVKD